MSSKRKMRRRDRSPGAFYEIVYDALHPPWFVRLSKETREALPALHALVRDDPRAAVAELRGWIDREPLPMFFNWLGGAYGALGETEAMRETICENYRRNPDYLFARANYAELCVSDGDLAGALEVLGPSLDLRPFLGGRKRVHVSEVAGYYYAVGLYHLASGDRAAAAKIHELLVEVAPDEAVTDGLGRRLYPTLLDRLLR